MNYRRISALLSALLLSSVGPPVHAQAPENGAPLAAEHEALEQEEVVTIAPYVWFPKLTGSVSLGPIGVPINLSAGEILSDVQAGGLMYARWHRGDNFFYFDGTLVDYQAPQSPSFFLQKVDATVLVVEAGGGPVLDLELGGRIKVEISPSVGARLTHVNAQVAGPLGNFSAKNNWVDPMAGVMVELPITSNLRALSKIEAGGLIVSDNDYYSALGVIDYSFAPGWTASAGYRWSKGNYRSQTGLNADLNGSGPLFGLSYSKSL